jgi:hypothetical protein
MTKLVIGQHSFQSQDKCVKFIQQALRDTGITASVKQSNLLLFDFLVALCERHPNKDAKLQDMCDLAIEPNAFSTNTYTLYVITKDGGKRDISWRVCVSSKKKTDKSLLRNALRYAVQSQIDDFRSKVLDKTRCDNCKCIMTSTPHIHHKLIDFEDIVRQFLTETKQRVPDKFDEDPVTHMRRFKGEDSCFAEEWTHYHKTQASLQYVCQSCNLSTFRNQNA